MSKGRRNRRARPDPPAAEERRRATIEDPPVRDTGDERIGSSPDNPTRTDLVAAMFESAATELALGNRPDSDHYVQALAHERFRAQTRMIDQAATQLLRARVATVWAHGWLPEDVYQMVRRNTSDLAASLVADAIADQLAQYPAATTHPVWHDQLDRIESRQWWDPSQPHLSQWAEQQGIDRVRALHAVVEVVALLRGLPPLPQILPLPGKATQTSPRPAARVDKSILSKVRALLAKAESTAFPDEAEALSAKAQELMNRYAIEQAMLEAEERAPITAAARRIWLDNPYLSAKSLLVANVASANRCRSVSHDKIGFVTVLGDPVDLETVELLTTSLLVQATNAMLAAGSQVTRTGESRTRSFRHSFLLAYATRIGERLRETTQASVATAGAALVPVIADRQRAVDELVDQLFPHTVRRSHTIGNPAGWGAGRAAADRARLQPERREVRDR